MLDALQAIDWRMMFLGDAPPVFLIEIGIRTVIIYGYSLLLIRWIGGRGIGQMSVVEFLLVVALGSAVGDAMFYPNVPLIHAMLVITLVVGINKLIDIAMCANPRVRRVFAGQSVLVVDQGRIDLAELRNLKLTREELFEGLRDKGIRNLGRVDQAYLEAGGHFSVFPRKGRVSGLALLPLESPPARPGDPRVCMNCAAPVQTSDRACPHCRGTKFARAEAEAAARPDQDAIDFRSNARRSGTRKWCSARPDR